MNRAYMAAYARDVRSLDGRALTVLAVAVLVLGLGLAACDGANLFGESGPLRGTDPNAPVVTIESPLDGSSFPLTDSVLVRVRIADQGGIQTLDFQGIAIRLDPLNNSSIVTRYQPKTVPFPQIPGGDLPRDTTITRYLQPTADLTSEPVFLIATATDADGNVRADTIQIIDGPRIQILSPLDGVTAGVNSALLVRVTMSDDVAGLDSMKLFVTGVVQDSVIRRNLAPGMSFDTTVFMPTGAVQGTLTLQASVWNRNNVRGITTPVNVTITATSTTDTDAPLVRRTVAATPRLELDDDIVVTVQANDGAGSGVVRMGVVAVATTDDPTLGTRTFAMTEPNFVPALSGEPERTFSFRLSELFDELETTLPRRFTIHIHAFAVDAATNCGASVRTTYQSQSCVLVNIGGVDYYTAAANETPLEFTAIAGHSVSIPGGGRIADAVVDGPNARAYLTNIENNKVEIFHIGPDTFYTTGAQTGRGLVGAAPWGLFINNAGDSLFVANSGGTNVSVMSIDPLSPTFGQEDIARRIITVNTVLFDVSWELDDGFNRYAVGAPHDFSDRPQFVAQHSSGAVLYSTVPTTAATPGTIRYLAGPMQRPEARILHNNLSLAAQKTIGLAYVDAITIVASPTADDLVVLGDHVPGTTTQIQSSPLPIDQAILDLRAQGSDVEALAGGWDIDAIAMSDTTFVAASSDRSAIAFGEGAQSPFGRIMLCCDIGVIPGTTIPNVELTSAPISVADLVNNAAERVFGIGLNSNGTLGVARGTQAAYFFTADEAVADPLRLQGEFRTDVAGGTGGATLHPSNDGVLISDPLATNRIAFVATPNRSIKIIDTVHFYERGEIQLRDNVVGPVKATLPSAAEQAPFLGTENEIIVRLIAVTADENVVIVDVRRKDIQN